MEVLENTEVGNAAFKSQTQSTVISETVLITTSALVCVLFECEMSPWAPVIEALVLSRLHALAQCRRAGDGSLAAGSGSWVGGGLENLDCA